MYNYLINNSRKIIEKNNFNLRFTHVAYILDGKQIICTGTNKPKTHPLLKKYPYREESNHIHAELDAILKLGKRDCSKYTIVVIRLGRSSHPRYSKPCPGCMHILKQLNFKSIWYSTDDGFENIG